MTHGTNWNPALYDDKHSFVWKLGAGLLELLAPQPGERILDLGCGTGHLTNQIAASGAQVVGIDGSLEMVERARENYPELSFSVMDAREITFREEFDAVFSNATLHWIQEPQPVVEGVARTLHAGGRFVAEFGGRGNTGKFLEAAERAWNKCGFPSGFQNPWYYPTVAEYAALLESHGLEVTFATLFDRPTPLEDGARGLRNWMAMFFGRVLERIPASQREQYLDEVEREARPGLFRDGRWIMDYRRLRIVAGKP